MNKHSLGFLVVASLATACASSAGSAGKSVETTPSSDTKYEIVIARPAVAGQRVRVEVKATENVDALAVGDDDTELEIEGVTEDRKVSLTGTLEILEVDDAGVVHRAQLHVESFRDELADSDVLPPGSTILATRDGEEFAIVVDGELPEEDLSDWLALAFPLVRPSGMFMGSALEPSSPKAVGESWELSRADVVSDLAGDGYETTQTQVQGEVTLVGTPECGGGKCLELSASLLAAQATLTEDWDFTAEKAGAVEGKARLLLPLDPERPVFLEEAEGAASFAAELKDEINGASVQARVNIVRRRTATYVPVSD